jgi:hypothetical protein
MLLNEIVHSYPTSFFRVIVSSQLLLPSFLDFMSTDDDWRWKDPAVLLLFDEGSTLPNQMLSRLNISFASNVNDFDEKCGLFATFSPFSQFFNVCPEDNQVRWFEASV